MKPSSHALALIGLVALAGVLTLYRLGAADVCGFNEAVEGVFTQQMVEHGELLFPRLNGRAPMYKPPLFHWTATAIDALAGWRRVTAFNLRLPAALYAIAGVALTVFFALDFFGYSAAVLAGLILCGAYQYIEQGRIGRVDMTLCFFETLALFGFIWWLRSYDQRSGEPGWRGRDSLRYLVAIALGLAVLSKGPIGAFLPAVSMALLLLAERRFAALRAIVTPGPVIAAIVIGSSWYLACYFSGHWGVLNRQLGSENVGRFFGSLGAMSPTYYLKPIFLNSGALSLFAVCAAAYATWITILRPEIHPDRGEAGATLQRAPGGGASGFSRPLSVIRLFAIFYFVTLIFFTIAAYKRRAYLLPVWPASAVLLAWLIEDLPARFHDRSEAAVRNLESFRLMPHLIRPAFVTICVVSIIFNFFFLPHKAIRDCGDDSLRATAASITRIVGADEPLYGYKLGAEPAALIFYLDRNLPPVGGKLGDAPPGYILTPVPVWDREHAAALDLRPIFIATSGRPRLVLLRHGPALALN